MDDSPSLYSTFVVPSSHLHFITYSAFRSLAFYRLWFVHMTT